MKRLILCILLVLAWCGTAGATKTITSCIFEVEDGHFINYGTSFRLKQGVPLVNAGAAAAAITEDIDGRTRPAGGLPDIGPYEGQIGLDFFPWRPMPLKFKETWRP